MITAAMIEMYLAQFAPLRLKMDFDNVGLIIGEGENEVKRVLVALDITPAVVEEAISVGAQCIVSHHPVIFKAIKKMTDNDPYGRMMIRMIKNGISAVCMHTNLDLAPQGVNELLAKKLCLEKIAPFAEKVNDEELGLIGLGRVGELPHRMEPRAFAAYVKKCLGSNGLRYVTGYGLVSKVAVGGGHCGDLMMEAVAQGCQAFVTSDLSYNDFLDAREYGLTLIDAGHYPTENVVVPQLESWLKEKWPELEVSISDIHAEVIEYVK